MTGTAGLVFVITLFIIMYLWDSRSSRNSDSPEKWQSSDHLPEENFANLSTKRKADFSLAHLFLHPIGWVIIWVGLFAWAIHG